MEMSSSSMLRLPGLAVQTVPAWNSSEESRDQDYLGMWDADMRKDLIFGSPAFRSQGVIPEDSDVFTERPLPYYLRFTALLVLFGAIFAASSLAIRELTAVPGKDCEYESDEEEEVKVPKEGFTKWQAIIALTNIMVGCCLLAVPFCLTRAGPLGFAALAMVGAAMCFSALLLGRCIKAVGETAQGRAVDPKQLDWLLVCRLAFGPFGAIVSLVIMPMDLFFHILNCTLVAGHLLPAVLPVGLMSIEMCTVTIGCMAFLLCMVPAKHLPGLSAVGTATQLCLLAFLAVTAMLLAWMTPETVANSWGGKRSAASVLSVFGVFFGAFNVHAMLPFFYSRLQDKNDWDSVMTVSMSMSTAFCATIGFICFVLFGIHTKEVFAENMGHTSTGMVIEGFGFMRPIGCGLLIFQQLSMVPAGWQALTSMASSKIQMTSGNEVLLGVVMIALSTSVAVAGSRVLPYVIAIEGDFVDFPIGIVIPVLAFLSLYWAKLLTTTRFALVAAVLVCFAATLPGEIIDLKIIFGMTPGEVDEAFARTSRPTFA